MHSNEEPWIPPKLQSSREKPILLSQVPEITILTTGDIKKNTESLGFEFSTTHSVPDLSIIDVAKSKDRCGSNSNSVFKNTRNEVIQQIKGEGIMRNNNLMKGLVKKSQYSPNPLCKYVPSKIVVPNDRSSIIVDSPLSSKMSEQCSAEDSKPLRSVPGILSEIQKLITPSKSADASWDDDRNSFQLNNKILKKLAKMYLTDDEYSCFAIDNEFIG